MSGDRYSVLIAGGGVAGLEAVLALREIERADVGIELLSPDPDFVLTPLSVVTPFSSDEPPTVPLGEFCSEHDATFTKAGLSEIWPEQQRVLTDAGEEIPYDALLLCLGARRRPILHDAISFRGGIDSGRIKELVAAARERGEGRIAFVVPSGVTWPLPLYELAMLVADSLRDTDVEVSLTTYEEAPLEPFGPAVSRKVAELLAEAGIEFVGDAADQTTAAAHHAADWLVTIPGLDVPEIPGLPQMQHGFVPVDPQMQVIGARHIWAVGDVTWSPLKQGGLAAQQADVAAASIAADSGVAVEVPPFVPVLRAALMTQDGPYYLRSGTVDEDGEQRAPLWWPPAKVAGRLLAPYLGAREHDIEVADTEIVDLEPDVERDVEHREAFELALRWADMDYEQGQLGRALHWLDVAEGLDMVLPDAYRQKRDAWRREFEGG